MADNSPRACVLVTFMQKYFPNSSAKQMHVYAFICICAYIWYICMCSQPHPFTNIQHVSLHLKDI